MRLGTLSSFSIQGSSMPVGLKYNAVFIKSVKSFAPALARRLVCVAAEAIDLAGEPVIRGGHGFFQPLHREQEQVMRLVVALQFVA